MESVLWAFKQLWDKGLVYQGFKVLPYCWRCETPLSNHELRMDEDTYRERQDPSVTVRFKLETGEWLLAWTTTPWTLPSNLACAVGADISYVVVAKDGERYILAADRQAAYERELEGAAVVGTLTGAELAGRRYEPLLPYLADTQNAFRVILSGDVTTEDGTGVVHMAPAYGEADAASCNEAGIPTVLTVDDQARFTAVVPDFEGQHVFDANAGITARLRADGSLVRAQTYTHSYPHCWRCRNPLIYKAVSSWFVAVSTFSGRMVELNEQISWVPGHVKDGQFGKWLARTRGTGRSAGTGSGARRSRSGRATTRTTRAPTYTGRWMRSSATSVSGPPTCTGPASTSSPGRTRTTRPAGPRCAGYRRCLTAGSSPDRCRSPRCTTRSRTATGSTVTTRATSSWSTSARPAAGSTRCTCWPPRCSTGPPSAPASATASCSATTGRRCPRACATTRT